MSGDINETRLEKDFDKGDFKPGASLLKISCWYLVDLLIFQSGLVPFSNILVLVLRLFGAQIGTGVRIKPRIQIKYPWKLTVGDYSWLSYCKIENLDDVIIGNHVCISQGALILTGNHDYDKVTFNLFTKPVVIKNGVWICANSTLCPGMIAYEHAVLCVGSVATKKLEPYGIYQGNPAKMIGVRNII